MTGRISQVSSHRVVEPGVPPSERWSIQVVMAGQPTPGEYQHKYKKHVLLLGGACLNIRNVAPKVPEVTTKEIKQSYGRFYEKANASSRRVLSCHFFTRVVT